MEAIFRGEAWDFMLNPVSEGNENAICASMASGCDAALVAYETSFADDLKALDACDAQQEPERYIALKVRRVCFRLAREHVHLYQLSADSAQSITPCMSAPCAQAHVYRIGECIISVS